ncbi:MAG: methyl-accepting chemotaxis protein [Leptospiraceae bacterium]|nr:methyl-accepting chemotaxis protein [Leptospiraceae bacterium]
MKNLKTRYKLIMLNAIPFLTILLISGVYTKNLYKFYNVQKNVSDLTTLFIVSGNLVHEMQKERGISAGFLSSKGLEYSAEVISQRAKVDEVFQSINIFFQRSSIDSNLTNKISYNFFLEISKKLSDYRKLIDGFEVTAKEEIPFYSKQLADILFNVLNGIGLIDNSEVAKIFDSYYKLILAKENSGMERAVINSVLSKKEFDTFSYETWIKVKSVQDLCLKEFNQLATADILEFFNQTINEKEIETFLQYRETVSEIKIKNEFTLKPKSWWDESTKRINLLKKVEDKIALKVKQEAEISAKQAFFQMIFFLIVMILVIVFILVSTHLLAEDILKSLQGFINRSKAISQGDLRILDKEMNRKDEFGLLSLNMNQMVKTLSMIVERLILSSEELNVSSQEIQSSANKSAETSTELAATVEEAGAAVENVSNIFGVIDTKISSGLDRVKVINQKAEQISSSILKLTSNSETLESKMSETRNSALLGEKELQNLINSIEAIRVTGNKVNDSLIIIKEISEQTNLLSLNASIEAARSGEFGRGFAVVAKNISKLSDLTNDSVEQIKKLTKSSESALVQGISSSNQTSKLFNELIDFIQYVSQEINKMNHNMKLQRAETLSFKEDISEFLNTFSQITHLSIEQKQSLGVINDTFLYNSQQAQISSASSEELASISQILHNKSIELKEIVSTFTL